MIVVTGASGYVGSRAVRRLVELGLPVTAMGRDETRLRNALPEGVPVILADYDDPASLARAFARATTLLFIASDGFAEDMIRHHANVIDAARRSPVRHVVFTSIVDAADASPFYFAPVYRDAERRLKAAPFTTSLIRCGLYCDFILQHWLRETAITLPLAEARIAPISRDDVAAAAVHAVQHEAGAMWELTGARSYSMDEIAAAATSILGRAFTYRPCAPENYLQKLAATVEEPWPLAFSSLCAAIREGRYGIIATDFAERLGRPQEDFESFLRRAGSRHPRQETM